MRKKQLPPEALASLQQNLEGMPIRSSQRKELIERTAITYGVSTATVYRALVQAGRPKLIQRADRGRPRKLTRAELERYCEIVAAMKIRTCNKKGRHLSTGRAIELLEKYGVDTPQGHFQPEPGCLSKSSVNRYLKEWGYDTKSLSIQPVSVRFQAEQSNECWQFDLSMSDLKKLDKPSWIEEGRGHPSLWLLSVVDDRSGVAYQEYRCAYGEDVELALRFLFNAMAPKANSFPFQGIPNKIYADNGPVTKSLVFQRVLESLGIGLLLHEPKDSDGRRVTARAKGKVERPFRTVKETHEVLYHFHKPETEEEANLWLHNHLVNYYNQRSHRSEPHSRIEDWLANLPETGYREMCSWERFCSFAREPEKRLVASDARVSVNGIKYEVAPELAGETVELQWGVFDNDLYVEFNGERSGPYRPIDGPIPLHRYRKFKKSKKEKKADEIEALARSISLPRAALTGENDDISAVDSQPISLPSVPFPEPVIDEPNFTDALQAKLAISHYVGQPIGDLDETHRLFIAELVSSTLNKKEVLAKVKAHFRNARLTERG